MRSRTIAAILPLFLLVAPALSAQVAADIYVTPIPNAPFLATVQKERTVPQPNGSMLRLTSTCTIARDNAGRIHNEMRPPLPATVPPQPVLRVHLYDPQNRMSEMLFPQQKTYTVQMLNRPPETDTVDDFASPSSDDLPVSQFARKEDLGRRTIAGLETHGVRVTQTLPAELSGTGAEVVVTNEYWYSEDLRINLIVRHNDPRTGNSSVTVTAVSRTEPDPSLFSIPADYKISMPQMAGAPGAGR